MPVSVSFSGRQFQAIVAILSRNVFLLINGIIFAVVILLVLFGDTQGGVILGAITVINVFIGSGQEINAWFTLEKLQLLALPKVVRVNKDGTASAILVEGIERGDKIKVKMGDQVPCDGVLLSTHGFDVSEALITGESISHVKNPGDTVLAGSIVTSGSGVIEADKLFAESRIALMTQSIKKYVFNLSPIQHSINTILKYIGYALLIIILFVAFRGLLVHESTVTIIQSIGALTSILLPQGMVVAITLLFSYGAAHLYGRHVLLQEVNATEKIGRIQNLCMDKTGTLTDNNLVVDRLYTAPGISEKHAKDSIGAYVRDTEDSSQAIEAIKKTLATDYTGIVMDDVTFSSSRRFGAVHIKDEFGERVVLAGAPDIFLPYFIDEEDKEWLKNYVDSEAREGKRLICFAQSDTPVLPQVLTGIKLSAIALVSLNNNLREGVREAVRFFQERGVHIRIISGDNPATVQAIAAAAGVNNTGAVITGPELAKWNDADWAERIRTYFIFARILPEQKEKIIETLKRDGFTAMIGDGANDALAIKKADLGIAMFDGAQATRQLAAVVLVKNSFTDLPNGVRLADSIIQNIEICAAIFFNEVCLGFFFFVLVTAFGYSFPFTPLNIAFLTYFTIGLPCALIFYWVVRPVHDRAAKPEASFLRRVIPFALVSAIPQALVTAGAFYASLEQAETRAPTSLVVLSFIIVGVIFFMLTPSVYSGPTLKIQKRHFYALVFVEVLSVFVLINIPFVAGFYNLAVPSLASVIELVPLISLYALVQYGITRWFEKRQGRWTPERISV